MTDAHVDGNLVTAPAWPAHPVWLAKYLQVLERSVDRPQERGFIGRQMAAPDFDPETDVGASKDKVQPICWPHPVSPLAPASTATPPLPCSASVVLHCAPQWLVGQDNRCMASAAFLGRMNWPMTLAAYWH